jgi:hypothetical protein
MEVSGQLHPRPLYPRGKNPWYPSDRRFGGPYSRSERSGEGKIPSPCQDSNPRSSIKLNTRGNVTVLQICWWGTEWILWAYSFFVRWAVWKVFDKIRSELRQCRGCWKLASFHICLVGYGCVLRPDSQRMGRCDLYSYWVRNLGSGMQWTGRRVRMNIMACLQQNRLCSSHKVQFARIRHRQLTSWALNKNEKNCDIR